MVVLPCQKKQERRERIMLGPILSIIGRVVIDVIVDVIIHK